MIGRSLFRYFALRYLSTVMWYIVGIMALTVVIDYTQIAARFAGLAGYSNGLAFQIAVFKSPQLLLMTLPFIGLFAAMTVLVQLNRKHELVVVRAAGVSAWQFLFPVMAGAFFVGLAALLLIDPLASKTFAYAEDMQSTLLKQKTGASATIDIPWIRQNDEKGATIIGAKAALDNGSRLSAPVFVFLDSNGLVTRRIDAAEARLANRNWVIKDAVVSSADGTKDAVAEMSIATTITVELLQDRLQATETVPFFQLPGKIAVARALGYPAYGLSTQFHSLLALPLLLVAMALIASTVTLKFVRFGQSASMIVGGIVAGFMLYVVTVLVKAFGGAGIVPPVVAAWFPVMLALMFGVLFLLHTEDG